MHDDTYIIYILNGRLLSVVVRDYRNNWSVFLDDNVQYQMSAFQKLQYMRFQQSYDLNAKWIILFKKYLKFAKASKRDQNISWPKTSCSRQLSWFVLVYICSLYHSLAWGLWLYWVLQNIYLTNDDTELLLWN